jgi:hypothetical protein
MLNGNTSFSHRRSVTSFLFMEDMYIHRLGPLLPVHEGADILRRVKRRVMRVASLGPVHERAQPARA